MVVVLVVVIIPFSVLKWCWVRFVLMFVMSGRREAFLGGNVCNSLERLFVHAVIW